MNITRFHLGEGAMVSPLAAGGAAYYRGGKYFELAEQPREVTREHVVATPAAQPAGPFVRGDFGDRDRLTWSGGGCAIPQDAKLVHWAGRYALWFDATELVVADATRPELARLALGFRPEPIKTELFVDDNLWLESARDVTRFARAELEALFAGAGSITVAFREHYPLARPNAKITMFVRYLFHDKAWLESPDSGWDHITIPFVPGLEEGAPVTLHDLVMTNVYREAAVENRPRCAIHHEPFPASRDRACTLRVDPAVDPAGQLSIASTSVRAADLDRVFALLADDPDDEANRMVVVDLLEDAGEPYAMHLAASLAGDERAREPALGPLANYLRDVEWHGGLPRGATLAATAPLDDTIVDIVLADYRLGFLHALRLGDGNFRLYSQLVTSPRAIGLRHVDGSRAQILTALIAANRTGLHRLSDVKFATREVIEALAAPVFDSVVEVETQTQRDLVTRLLEFITRDPSKFFARAPRHLRLVERDGHDDALVLAVLAAWPKLPVAKLTMGGITIVRDGTAHAAPDSSDFIRDIVARQFRFG
jgi:hypothetical protein